MVPFATRYREYEHDPGSNKYRGPMNIEVALPVAERVVAVLKPHCKRIEIAGSIRRKKTEVGDIEVVYIPKMSDMYKLVSIIDKWYKKKGDAFGKYTQRLIEPEGIKLDLFRATEENWGFIFAIRTGSAEYSKHLADAWVKAGYRGEKGMLISQGKPVPVYIEFCQFRESNDHQKLYIERAGRSERKSDRARTGPIKGQSYRQVV